MGPALQVPPGPVEDTARPGVSATGAGLAEREEGGRVGGQHCALLTCTAQRQLSLWADRTGEATGRAPAPCSCLHPQVEKPLLWASASLGSRTQCWPEPCWSRMVHPGCPAPPVPTCPAHRHWTPAQTHGTLFFCPHLYPGRADQRFCSLGELA